MKQKLSWTAASMLLAFLCLVPVYSTAEDTGKEEKSTAAIMAAEDFLLLIDTGQYGKSWDVASSLFQNRVPKDTWVQQISSIRPALGALNVRKLVSAEFMTELPGAPDGEYVVIQYSSSFAGKENGVETVTPMLDKDGRWRVSGYYIR